MSAKLVNKWKRKEFLLIILFLQVFMYIFVFFNIPIVRQIIGFIYLTFVPGLVIIRLLKLNELVLLEIFLFSVGFSIVFLMVIGLLVNEFFFLTGFLQPLSLIPLITTLNSMILILTIFPYLRGDDFNFRGTESFGFPLRTLFLITLPILSVIGAIIVNIYKNNWLLLIIIISIALVFSSGVLSMKLSFSKFYPLIVLAIAVTLLYHSSFISDYFVTFGSDIPGEYFVFKITERNAYWSSIHPYIGGGWSGFGRLNTLLSLTILPTIYSVLLNIDSKWIFKMLYPLIFSLVPLGLYQLWQLSSGKKYAFISAFLLMAEATFYTEILGLNRQMIAELFFVLLLLVITNKTMKHVSKKLCFMIFSFGLTVSHYGLAEIFLFFIFVTLISLIVLKRPSRNITVGMVLFFLAVMFSWYIYTSRSAVFESFLEFGDYVYRQLGDFFNLEARGQTVMRGLGLEAPPTLWNMFSRLFAYLTEALIAIGFLGLITKKVKIVSEKEYFTMIVTAMAFLFMLILVPGLAKTMNMTRFYHLLLFFLAPFCTLGAETIVRIAGGRNLKIKVSIILLVVLIPYFLFQSGFIYEVTGNDSWSVPLSGYRMNTVRLHGLLGYSTIYSVFGAQWLSENIKLESYTRVYADYWGRRTELRSYGLIYLGYIETLTNVTEIKYNELLYMSSLNVIEGIVVGEKFSWNTSELRFIYDLNKIYSNGGSEIYKNGS